MRLQGQVAVITGGGRGIGKAIALAMAAGMPPMKGAHLTRAQDVAAAA